jgi:tRNA (uracil-5-)-methyltransferase TRM9
MCIQDYAISVATIHHLATHDRRKNAVKVGYATFILDELTFYNQRLLQSVSPVHGRILIYVWAIEQDELSKRSVPVSGTAGEEGQDVFVPWVLTPQSIHKPKTKKRQEKGKPQDVINEPVEDKQETQVFNRYYHMFSKGELHKLVLEAAHDLHLTVGSGSQIADLVKGVEIVQEGWERSNYYVELRCWRS